MLYRLIAVTGDFKHAVVSLHQDGVYGQPLRDRGVTVTALGMPRGRLNIAALRRLQRIIAEYRPHVVQTWLDHANLVGGLTARLAGAPPVIWAVHCTDLGPLRSSWKTRLVRRCCARLSSAVPTSIISPAESGAALHRQIGFNASKLLVVPNGVDPAAFQPDRAARERTRRRWRVAPEETLIGCVARWHPIKDHENLVRAVRQLADRGHSFRCALVGQGMEHQNTALTQLIERWGVADRMILVGPSNEVPAVMNALDLHVLASRSESLPVAVLEAMACGTPCAVTDVGDARHMVGDTGWVAPPRDCVGLADAIGKWLVHSSPPDREERARMCRARVIRDFSLSRMGSQYAALWTKVAAGRHAA